MFGLFKQNDEKQAENYQRMIDAGVRNAELHEELFNALRDGRFKTAQKIVEMGTPVQGLAMSQMTTWGGAYVTDTWNGHLSITGDSISDYFKVKPHRLLGDPVQLFDCGGRPQAMVSLEKFFKVRKKRDVSIYDPLSYFILEKNSAAADFLVRNGYPLNAGRDDPQECFRRDPLYQAIDKNAVLLFKLMLEKGAKPTDKILRYAVIAQKADLVGMLIQRGASIEVGKQALADLVQAQNLKQKTFDALAEALKLPALQKKEPETPIETVKKLLAHGANVDKPAATPTPAPAVPDHHVIFERTVAGLTMQEIYDFEHKERVTLFKKGDDIKNSLRQTFNELGRKDEGLQKAIDVYTERYPGFDAQILFAKPSTYKIVAG